MKTITTSLLILLGSWLFSVDSRGMTYEHANSVGLDPDRTPAKMLLENAGEGQEHHDAYVGWNQHLPTNVERYITHPNTMRYIVRCFAQSGQTQLKLRLQDNQIYVATLLRDRITLQMLGSAQKETSSIGEVVALLKKLDANMEAYWLQNHLTKSL